MTIEETLTAIASYADRTPEPYMHWLVAIQGELAALDAKLEALSAECQALLFEVDYAYGEGYDNGYREGRSDSD